MRIQCPIDHRFHTWLKPSPLSPSLLKSSDAQGPLISVGGMASLSASGQKPALSLLAHKSQMHKAINTAADLFAQFPTDVRFPDYESPWCPCGGYPEYCDLLQVESERRLSMLSRSVGEESCGRTTLQVLILALELLAAYPCLNQAGNCLYSAATTVNTTDGYGSRECFCANVPPGQCTQANFPGYTIVQNGAYNVTTGRIWYIPGWKRVDLCISTGPPRMGTSRWSWKPCLPW